MNIRKTKSLRFRGLFASLCAIPDVPGGLDGDGAKTNQYQTGFGRAPRVGQSTGAFLGWGSCYLFRSRFTHQRCALFSKSMIAFLLYSGLLKRSIS